MSDGVLLNDANISGTFTDRRGLTLNLNATLRCNNNNPVGTFSGTAFISTFGLRQQISFNSNDPIFIRTLSNNFGSWLEVVFRNVTVSGTSLGMEIPNSTVILRARQTAQNRWLGQLSVSNPLGLRFSGTGAFTGNLQVNRNVRCRQQPLLATAEQESQASLH